MEILCAHFQRIWIKARRVFAAYLISFPCNTGKINAYCLDVTINLCGSVERELLVL